MKWFLLPIGPRFMSRTSGLVTNAAGAPDVESAVANVVLAAIVGGFAGMISGFLLSNVLRGLSLHALRPWTGTRMILLATLLGAIVFPLLSSVTEQDD